MRALPRHSGRQRRVSNTPYAAEASGTMKRALITGITGQDGSYLAELLLDKGYEVHGIVRPAATFPTQNIDHILSRLTLHYGDMLDGTMLERLLGDAWFDEVYNLAAQSHVATSFAVPEYTCDVIALGTLRLLEAIKNTQGPPDCGLQPRIYQASSSEMFGNAPAPQNEDTPFDPRSPYACAKVFAHQLCQNYRRAYGMHVSCGILFNHESPRRSPRFVTRKVTKTLAEIKKGKMKELCLGNLDAVRDWGWAPDYVDAMWRMLQQDTPDDYVIGTGECWSVRQWVDACCAYAMIRRPNDFWLVEDDTRFTRPTDVDRLHADPAKAKRVLGWAPTVRTREMAYAMMEHDLRHA